MLLILLERQEEGEVRQERNPAKQTELSAHEDEEDGDIGRGDTRDAGGLGEGFGIDGGELLAGFGGKALNGVVVEVSADVDVFQTVHLVGGDALTVDVTLVLYLYLRCFRYFLMTVGRGEESFLQTWQTVGEGPDAAVRA